MYKQIIEIFLSINSNMEKYNDTPLKIFILNKTNH